MDYVALGVLVEEMHSGHIDGNLDGISGAGGGVSGNRRDSVLLCKVEVEVDLRTHKLGNIDCRLNDILGMSRNRRLIVVDALGTLR